MTETYYRTEFFSPIGVIVLLADCNGLCGVWFEGQKYFGGKLLGPDRKVCRLSGEKLVRRNENAPGDKAEEGSQAAEILKEALLWLEGYFAGDKMPQPEIPLSLYGSEFQKQVWALLCEIPYGETVTYGELSRRVAGRLGRASMSAQAVGGAVGHNPISILVPCHRVVGAGGTLTGYAGGLDRKQFLLTLEGIYKNSVG